MFTGIIEEIGKVISVEPLADGRRLTISAPKIVGNMKNGDSICVNGICLTVTKLDEKNFWCEAVGTTLVKSNLSELKINSYVNLERALLVSDRIGGHIVQGHVNGTGIIEQINKIAENYLIEISIPPNLKKYVVEEGSITVDGISLTVAAIAGNKIGLSIIPHTWENTNLNKKRAGDKVNIETDIIAKYVGNLLVNNDVDEKRFTDSWFKELGY